MVVAVVACTRDSEPERDPAVAVIAASSELPPWFGLRALPARRIAGRLLDGDGPIVGVVHLRIDAPDATVWKGLDTTRLGDQSGPLVGTAADGAFELRVSRGRVDVTCEDKSRIYAYGEQLIDLEADTRLTVRMVKRPVDGVDAGVGFAMEASGARVTAGADGLEVGDLVRAANGVSLAGLPDSAMQALAFSIPKGASVMWTISRNGKLQKIMFTPS